MNFEPKRLPNDSTGCGSVGRAVASNSTGSQFESSHRQKTILNIYCQLYRKEENKEKEAWRAHFLKKNQFNRFRHFTAEASFFLSQFLCSRSELSLSLSLSFAPSLFTLYMRISNFNRFWFPVSLLSKTTKNVAENVVDENVVDENVVDENVVDENEARN